MKTIHIATCTDTGENRIPLSPESCKKLRDLGLRVTVEQGAGIASGFSDSVLAAAGAEMIGSPETGLKGADIAFFVARPTPSQREHLRPGTVVLGMLDPFNAGDDLERIARTGVTAISLEMMPRSTLAQKMDVLSSQANLAGYAAVVLAAQRLDKILPMMMTPSGTIQPACCFVLGVGVAGLQAIATAKRMGARVEAFDTRPVVEEQVKSLGGKFLKIDLGNSGQTAQGYAQALTEEQLLIQRKALARACARADIVITTAKLFGRKAPILLTDEALDGMRPGSIIVDLAVETGGNVAGSRPGETVTRPNGVHILGPTKAERTFPTDASAMLAANYANLIIHFWDKERGEPVFPEDDPILAETVITHGGEVVHPSFRPKLSPVTS